MATYILGINSGLRKHDGAAALLKDGHLVAMAEQERFSRRKHAFGELPVDAIQWCLATEQIGLHDVAVVAIGWDERLHATVDHVPFDEEDFLNRLLPRTRFTYAQRPEIRYVEHHIAHAASAFWPSGFTDAAIMVIDGRGELHATTLAHGKARTITILKQFGTHESLGNFYGLSSEWTGLTYYGAGKFMGLSAYGKATQPMPLVPTADGYMFIDMAPPVKNTRRHFFQMILALEKHYRSRNYPYTAGDGSEPMAYANFAASVQKALEDVVLHLARALKEQTQSPNLVLAGGVGLNCVNNYRVAQSNLFSGIFVQPLAYDAGVSLGAALQVWHETCADRDAAPFRMTHLYWGPEHDTSQIEQELRAAGVRYVVMPEDDLVQHVAACLAQHRIVGWFQGRAEIGPRALGARSILGNPSRRDTLVRINNIKRREVWRPLAPSILEEHFAAFFDSPLPSDYMIVASQVHKHVQHRIPAVVHVDGSTRPQIVRRATNERYWKMIQGFNEQTGIPLVLNTSFNLAGEPMVNTPKEAIADFLHSDLDVLAIGNCVAHKER